MARQADNDAEAKAQEIALLAAREKRIEAKSDGSLVVRLLESVTVESKAGTLERATVTVRVAKVRDLRRAQRAIREGESDVDAYADQLVDPAEAYDEIANIEDQATIRGAVDQQLGKFLGTGRDS